MAESHRSADRVIDPAGRPYHIGVGPGEVAPSILLVGDPARAERCAARFEGARRFQYREFTTFTGTWQGTPLSVMATGIGCDNTEIAVIELASLLPRATLVRAGTCGGVQPDLALGDLVITWGAVRLENTSTQFVPEGYPAVAHPEVIRALERAAAEIGAPSRTGMTATAPGFYGAQARDVPGFPPRHPDRIEELARIGVLNIEMEASTLLTLASLRGFRAGAVCTVFAERSRNRFVAAEGKQALEDRVVEVGLRALKALAAD
jgi:uridine phosphorylase